MGTSALIDAGIWPPTRLGHRRCPGRVPDWLGETAGDTDGPAANYRRVTGLSDPQSGEASGQGREMSGETGGSDGEASGLDADALRQELAANVVPPKKLPGGY